MPAMLPVCALSLAAILYMSKLLLVKYQSKPPSIDHTIAEYIVGCLPWGFVLHLGFAIWMLSGEMFTSDLVSPEMLSTISFGLVQLPTIRQLYAKFVDVDFAADFFHFGRRLTRWNSVPLMLLLGFFIFSRVWFGVVYPFLRPLLARVLAACSLRDASDVEEKDRHFLPGFTEPYVREVDDELKDDLTKLELAEGWKMELRMGTMFKYRLWLSDGVRNGITHWHGGHMRTWEVRACERAPLIGPWK
jgi:hypothetical protein